MYIHLGDTCCACESEIIGIFDLEITTTMKTTGEFLKISEEEGFVTDICENGDMPKTFILAEKNGQSRIYISHVSASTLRRRCYGRRNAE